MKKTSLQIAKNLYFYILLAVICFPLKIFAASTDIVGFRNTINEIIPMIETGINTLQNRFNQNQGNNMNNNIIVLDENSHPWLESIIITHDYKLIVKFADAMENLEYYNPYYLTGKKIMFLPNIITLNLSFFDQNLINRSVYFNAIIASGENHYGYHHHDGDDHHHENGNGHHHGHHHDEDEQNMTSKKVISGFECVTNIDENQSMIAGDIGTKEGRRSILAHLTENSDSKYLGNCIFLTTQMLNSL